MTAKRCMVCDTVITRGDAVLEPYLSAQHHESFFHAGLDEIIETAVQDGTAQLCCHDCAGGSAARRALLAAAALVHWDRL